jgi:hypothetical protein
VLMAVRFLRDETGRISGYLGMARDINESKKAEADRAPDPGGQTVRLAGLRDGPGGGAAA